LKQIINCLKEDNSVINKKLKEVSIEEGLKIATELLEIMVKRKDAIGLAANQVGIDAAVAVVNVREPVILINPVVVDVWDEIPYYESCLSFKGKRVNTKRYKNVVITTEQEESKLYFSGVPNSSDGRGSWEEDSSKKQDEELRLLETICVQHEIDHLNGMTIMDRKMISTVINTAKTGRNEPCPCGSGKKYKKCCLKK
jgi:peptide deformylase